MIPLITSEAAVSSRKCRRVGFWYRRIWFGFSSWSCQTTNRAQLCGFGTRVSSSDFCLYNPLDHCFMVFKNVKQGVEGEKVFALVVTWSTLNNSTSSRLTCFFVLVLVCFLRASSHNGSPCLFFWKSAILRYPNPIDQEREYHPCANQRSKKWLRIQWDCERLKFVSHTSNFWERILDFQRYRKFLLMVISNFQGPQQSLSLGIIPIDNAVPNFPHGHIVGDHSCCECTLPQALVNCVTAGANLFTDPKLSSLPIRANNKKFRTNWEHTFGNSPTVSTSSLLGLWSAFLLVNAQILPLTFSHDLPQKWPRNSSCVRFLPPK